jgi:hypothetical protein
MYDRCRLALRLQLDLLKEPESVYAQGAGGAPRAGNSTSGAPSEKRTKVLGLHEQVVDLLV